MDCGVNSYIEYSIEKSYSSQFFKVNNNNGDICLDNIIDREISTEEEISIIATDGGLFQT